MYPMPPLLTRLLFAIDLAELQFMAEQDRNWFPITAVQWFRERSSPDPWVLRNGQGGSWCKDAGWSRQQTEQIHIVADNVCRYTGIDRLKAKRYLFLFVSSFSDRRVCQSLRLCRLIHHRQEEWTTFTCGRRGSRWRWLREGRLLEKILDVVVSLTRDIQQYTMFWKVDTWLSRVYCHVALLYSCHEVCRLKRNLIS